MPRGFKVNRDAAGVVRYTGYDPHTSDCHFAVDLSKWGDGSLPPTSAAILMDTAPALLEAFEKLAQYMDDSRPDYCPLPEKVREIARDAIAQTRERSE